MNSRERAPIIVIGSVNTDMVATAPTLPAAGETVMGTNFFVSAGGKGGNQAVAAARLQPDDRGALPERLEGSHCRPRDRPGARTLSLTLPQP